MLVSATMLSFYAVVRANLQRRLPAVELCQHELQLIGTSISRLSLASFLARLIPLAFGQANIEGIVVDAVTRQPLSKASLQFSPFSPGVSRRTTTDAEGKFSINELKAGEYTVTTDRRGYATSVIGMGLPGLSTMIQQNDHFAGVVLKLRPSGRIPVITGIVLAPDGKPPLAPSVRIWRVLFQNGRSVFNENRGQTVDADGTFVIGGLTPGIYYLAAHQAPRAEIQLLDQTRHQGLTTTYYPDTTNFESAQAIEVRPDKEIRNIRLILHETSLRKLSGTTVNPIPGSHVINRFLYLSTKNPLGMLSVVKGPELLTNDGAFRFDRVPPGDYILEGVTKVQLRGVTSAFLARTPVHVRDADSTGVEVHFNPLVRLKGTVRGMPVNAPPGLLPFFVGLHAADFSESIQISRDGSFSLQVPPGEYRASAGNGLQRVWGARSILFNGKDVLNHPITITPDGGTFQISFAELGQITGVVRDHSGMPLPGATVGLWQDHEFITAANSDLIGRYTLPVIPEGSYRVAAWEDVDRGIASTRDFVDQFDKQFVAIQVRQGAEATRNLTAIPYNAAELAISKLK